MKGIHLVINTMRTLRWSKRPVVVLAGVVLLAGNAGAAGALDDAQIVRRVVDFNRAEEQTSDAVGGRLVSPAVWQLARRMSVESAALDHTLEGLAPAAGPSDPGGTAEASPEGPDLSKLSGDDLEQAYVDREVKSHETMLAALDWDLLPGARSEELRRRLAGVRAEVAAQLQQAKNVQHAEWIRQTLERQRADISREVGNDGA